MTPDVEPFHISISDQQLDDLHARLEAARWPAELPNVGWDRGVPLDYLQELTKYWHEHFNWRRQEAQLNALPQFTTRIDGQTIHFAHIRSAHPHATPLLLLHGWPGNFVEFLHVVEPLTNPDATGEGPAPAFDLVIPCLPGFGFSTPLAGPGMGTETMARILVKLMSVLEYQRYGVQGYDIGSWVASEMARQAPEHILGVHLNSAMTFPTGIEGETEGLSETDQQRWDEMQGFDDAYFHVNSKRPQTIAYGLTDSPIGQLAWIMDIYKAMTHPVEELPDTVIDRDLMLTNISVFWFTATAASAAQVYYEDMTANSWAEEDAETTSTWTPTRGTVPTAVLVSAQDITVRAWAERDYNLVRWTELEDGGHFLSMERPELLVDDVRAFFSQLY